MTSRFRPHRLLSSAIACSLPVVLASIIFAGTAQAWTYSVLYAFPTAAGPRSLTLDAAGNIFGVAQLGGAGKYCTAQYGCGYAFEMVSNGDGTYSFNDIYDFCGKLHCKDGYTPTSRLVTDSSGNLYGVTYYGITQYSDGVFYELSLVGKKWQEKALINFPVRGIGGDNTPEYHYAGSSSGQPWDGVSPLYGSGYYSHNGSLFTLYSITPPSGSQTKWSVNFVGKKGSYANPTVWVTPTDGFGTDVGGTYGLDRIIQLSHDGAKWKESTIYSFSDQDNFSGAGLVGMNQNGELFGSATDGNAKTGALFKYSNGKVSLLHQFCSEQNCDDGNWINFPPIFAGSNEMFGTTFAGGTGGGGVVYEMSGKHYKVLYDFAEQSANGWLPMCTLAMDSSGNLYGTTDDGGQYSNGVVFKLSP